MSEAPDELYFYDDWLEKHTKGRILCGNNRYLRADLAHALVAEAYEVAEQAALCAPLANGESPAILQGDEARGFAMGISSAHVAVGKLTPADAIAARDARDKQVREQALNEAAALAYEVFSDPDALAKAILALIEKDNTNE